MKLARTLGTALAATAALATVGMATASPAFAAPTQSTIDGRQPSDMGCRADQKVIFHAIINGAGEQQGYVDLVASTYCHAAWAHVHSVRPYEGQTWVAHGRIARNSDGRNYPCSTNANGEHDCYTPMVWDKGVTSYAWGEVDPNGCCGAGPYSTRTGNY